MKIRTIFLVLALLFTSAGNAQNSSLPIPQNALKPLSLGELEAARSGVPYRQFSAWLEVFNTGDRTRIGEFLKSSWPSRNLDLEMSMWERSGGFDLREIEEFTDNSITGIVESRDSEEFARFNLVVESTEPRKISTLNRRLIPRPSEFPVPRLSDAQLISALGVKLDKATSADHFAGAVLVAKNGKTLFTGAYGLADREKRVANTLDTRFRIGSMNKMFTGTAILQLVQSGKVKLNDPVGKYLTDYPNQDVATKVTIHQLLTHTGGTGDIFGSDFDAHRLELRTLGDYVALYGRRGLAFEPGTRWEYSNYGMVLLGAVIEKVTGRSYYDYVAEEIFKPAGMTRTGSEPEETYVPGRAIGYMRPPGSVAWMPNTDTLPYRGTSAGGGYSTVGDLMRFADALMHNKLLDAEHTQLLTTGKVNNAGGGRYAYGFEDLRSDDGAGSVGHGGGAPGMSGMLRIFPKSGYVVVVLSNLDPPAAQLISGFLELRLGGRASSSR